MSAVACSYAIDLATICFDSGKSPDRLSAVDAVQVPSQYPSLVTPLGQTLGFMGPISEKID